MYRFQTSGTRLNSSLYRHTEWNDPLTHVRSTQVFLLPLTPLGLRLPMSQPHPRKTLTTFGVTAAAIGIRMKMKLL